MTQDIETRLEPLRGDWLGTPTPVSQLAARARRRRALRLARRSGAGLVLAVIIAGLVWGRLGDGDASPRITVAGGGAQTIFVPPTHSSGDHTALPLTFFDGTRLELVYPSGLRLGDGSFVPGATAGISASATGGRPLPGRTIIVHYGQVSVLTQEQPARTYAGVNGTTVGLYPSAHVDPRFPPLDVLGFQFGNWGVFVEDLPPGNPNDQRYLMTDAERSIWADHLGGHVSADGFLILDPTSPLTLGGSDQPVGVIGGQHPGSIQVLFYGCAPKISGSPHWVFVRRDDRGSLFCRTDHGVSIRVDASVQAATRIVQSISLRNLRPGTVEATLEARGAVSTSGPARSDSVIAVIGTRLVVLSASDGRPLRTLATAPPGGRASGGIAASAKTGRIYYTVGQPCGPRPEIWQVPIGGGAAHQLVSNGAAPAVSPDGRFLAYTTGFTTGSRSCAAHDALAIRDLRTGKEQRSRLASFPSVVLPLAWWPDSRRVEVSVGSDIQTVRVDATGLRVVTNIRQLGNGFVFLPNREAVTALPGTTTSRLVAFDPSTGAQQRTVADLNQPLVLLDSNPAGTSFLLSTLPTETSGSPTLYRADVANPQPIKLASDSGVAAWLPGTN